MVRTATKKKPETVIEQVALPIEEATVQERQITIRVLTLGARQITQTLYRQLVEKEVIDAETGCLQGTVWGWVNLHTDCDEKTKHLHVIWEDEGQLKRSCTLSSYQNWYHAELSRALRRLTIAYACLVALANKKFNGQQEGDAIYLTVKGVSVKVSIPRAVVWYWQMPSAFERTRNELADLQEKGSESEHMRYWGNRPVEERIKDLQLLVAKQPDAIVSARQDVIKETREALQNASLDPEQYISHDQVYSEMEKIAAEIATFEQNWKKSYKAISAAGQLFVAVSGVWK